MLLTGYRQTLSTRPMTGIHQLPIRDFLAMLFVLTRAAAMIGRLNLPDKDNRRLRQKGRQGAERECLRLQIFAKALRRLPSPERSPSAQQDRDCVSVLAGP